MKKIKVKGRRFLFHSQVAPRISRIRDILELEFEFVFDLYYVFWWPADKPFSVSFLPDTSASNSRDPDG